MHHLQGTVFKVFKSVGDFLSGYIVMIWLVVIALFGLLKSKSIVSIPDKFLSFLNKMIGYTDNYLFFVIGVSVAMLLFVVLLSSVSKIKKIVYSVVFIVYVLVMNSTVKFLEGFLLSKLTMLDAFVSRYLAYIVVFFLLTLIKELFKISKLTVAMKIDYTKVDTIVDKYLHEEDNFNMDLCDDLMRKYGGF